MKGRNMYYSFKKIRINLILLVTALTISLNLKSQVRFPVNAFTQVLPPYSAYLNDYASLQTEKLAFTLTLTDAERPMLDVRLKITIEGQGIEISTRENYMGTPITLHQNIPERISGAMLTTYLDPYNLDFKGITRAEFLSKGSKLNEGLYHFSVRVFEARRGVEVSNPIDPRAKAMAMIVLNNPPMWITPSKNQVVKASDPPNIMFSWLSMNTGSPNSAFTTEYEFTLTKLIPEGASPEIAINTNNPLYQTITQKTRLHYGADAPMLEPGHKYVCRLRAYDINGTDLFKNNGYSEVLVFTFGKPCMPPINIRNIGTSKQDAELDWAPFYDHTEFVVEYREENQNEWYQDVATQAPYRIQGLNSAARYQYKVKGVCGSLCSKFSLVKDFRTAAVDNSTLDCNGANAPAVDGSPLISELNIGDIITVGGFDTKITSVTQNNGKFSGECMVSNFWLFQMNAKFTDIQVNESMQVTTGKISAVRSTVPSTPIPPDPPGPGPQPGEDVVVNPTGQDTTITHNDLLIHDVRVDDEGNIIITYDDETSEKIITDENKTIEIIDKDGNRIVTTPNGKTTYNGKEVNSSTSEVTISKICIKADKKKVIVYKQDNKKRKYKLKENLEIKCKSGYTYIVKNNTVEVKQDNHFIYPPVIQEGTCYVIGSINELTIPNTITQICINIDGFSITDNLGQVKDYSRKNILLKDNSNVKIVIDNNYKVKIESSSGAQGIEDDDGNILPANWQRNEDCFSPKSGTGNDFITQHEVIEKICFDDNSNEVEVFDNTGESTKYNGNLLKFKDKEGYQFKAENKILEIIKTDKFVYPTITKEGNCYTISPVIPFDVNKKLVSVCITTSNIKVKDENGIEETFEGLSKIFTDRNETRFMVNEVGAVKIKTTDNFNSDEYEWKQESNCFNLVSINTNECDESYNGDIDLVFNYNNNLYIKSKTGNSIKNIGEPRDLCISYGDKILDVKTEGNGITLPEGFTWRDSRIKRLTDAQKNGPMIFRNMSAWKFKNYTNVTVKEYKDFPIQILLLDYVLEKTGKESYDEILNRLGNYYNSEYSSILVLKYTREGTLEELSSNSGRYNQSDFNTITSDFKNSLETAIENNTSPANAIRKMTDDFVPVVFDKYNGSYLQRVVFPLTEYYISVSPNTGNDKDELELYSSYHITANYNEDNRKIILRVEDVVKELNHDQYIRIKYPFRKNGKIETKYMEVPGVFAYLVFKRWISSNKVNNEIEDFVQQHDLHATGTTSEFDFEKLFEKLRTFHRDNHATINRADYQDFTGSSPYIRKKLEGFNESFDFYIPESGTFEINRHNAGVGTLTSIFGNSVKYCLEYYANNEVVISFRCNSIIDLFTLAMKMGIEDESSIDGLLRTFLDELNALAANNKCNEIDEILEKVTSDILKHKVSNDKKLKFLQVLSDCDMDNTGVDEEAIVIKIFNSIEEGKEKDFLDKLLPNNFIIELIKDIDGAEKLQLGKAIYNLWEKSYAKSSWKLSNNNKNVILSGDPNGEITKYPIYPNDGSHKLLWNYDFDVYEQSQKVHVKEYRMMVSNPHGYHKFYDPILLLFTKYSDGGNKKDVTGLIVPAIYAYCFMYDRQYTAAMEDLKLFISIASYATAIHGIVTSGSNLAILWGTLNLSGDIANDIFKALNVDKDSYAADFCAFWNLYSTFTMYKDITKLGIDGFKKAKRAIMYYDYKNPKLKEFFNGKISKVDCDDFMTAYRNQLNSGHWTQEDIDDLVDYLGYKGLQNHGDCKFSIEDNKLVLKYKDSDVLRLSSDGVQIIRADWNLPNLRLTDAEARRFLADCSYKTDYIDDFINNPELLEYWKMFPKTDASILRRNIDNIKVIKESAKRASKESLADILTNCKSKQKLIDQLAGTNALLEGVDGVTYGLRTISGGYAELSMISGSKKIAVIQTHGNSIKIDLTEDGLKNIKGTSNKDLGDTKITGKDGEDLTGELSLESKDREVWFKRINEEKWIDDLEVLLGAGTKNKIKTWIRDGLDANKIENAFNTAADKAKLFDDLDNAKSIYHQQVLVKDFANIPGVTAGTFGSNGLTAPKSNLAWGDPDLDLISREAPNFVNAVADELPAGTKIYRVTGGRKDGGYWTIHKPTKVDDVIGGTAVRPEWNSFEKIYEFEVPAGETLKVWRGTTARQRVTDGVNNYYLAGGDEQIFIPQKLRDATFAGQVIEIRLPW